MPPLAPNEGPETPDRSLAIRSAGQVMQRCGRVAAVVGGLVAGACVESGGLHAQSARAVDARDDVADRRVRELIRELRATEEMPPNQQHFDMLRRDESKDALALAKSRAQDRRECMNSFLRILQHPSSQPQVLAEVTRYFRFLEPQPNEWLAVMPALIGQIARVPLDHPSVRTMRDTAREGIASVGIGNLELAAAGSAIAANSHVVAHPLQQLAMGQPRRGARFLRNRLAATPLPDRPFRMPFFAPQPNLEEFYFNYHIDRWTRIYAAEGLSMLGDHGAREAASLLQPPTGLFGNGLEHARPTALEVLARMGQHVRMAYPALAATLNYSKDPWEHSLAAQALSQMLPDPEVRSLLFRRHRNPDVLRGVAQAMSGSNESGIVRALVLELEGSVHSPAAEVEYLRMLANADASVLAAHAATLIPLLRGRVGGGGAETAGAPPLDANPTIEIRRLEVRILRRTASAKELNLPLADSALNGIVAALQDDHLLVRAAAAAELGELGPAAAAFTPKIRASLNERQFRPLQSKSELEQMLLFQEAAEASLRKIERREGSSRP